ncbi:MAG TPA: hypothetical protein ENJ09_07250 [Planctomycetes bacterium]|nr:hypothetical protein [Planctomycetota bacterium]
MLLLTSLLLTAAPALPKLNDPAWESLPIPIEWSSSMGARLVAGLDGETYVHWVEESKEDGARLRYSVLGERGWGEPRTVAAGSDWLVNWADAPVLAVAEDGSMAATWLVHTGAEGTWDYGIRLAVSRDGDSWSDPVRLHDDPAGPEHGFVSLVPMPAEAGGGFEAVWLDSRAMKGGEGEHGTGAMQLLSRRIQIAGPLVELGPELVLDDRTCDCCQTSAVSDGAGGVLVAYRDRSPKEVRDISLVRIADGKLDGHMDPPADRWTVSGCPVNGPSLARRGAALAAAWFTMDLGLTGKAKPQPMVRACFGTTSQGFGSARRVDLGKPIGRATATFGPDGHLFVAWLEQGGDRGARWLLQDLGTPANPATDLGSPEVLGEVEASRRSGFASLLWNGERLLFAFTRTAEDGTTRVDSLVRR